MSKKLDVRGCSHGGCNDTAQRHFMGPKSKSYIGTVDYGTAIPENEDKLATEALVFMVVGMTGHWKHMY